jgi:UDP-N-acetylglucosamine 2-epimerase (non-hydrolysing)
MSALIHLIAGARPNFVKVAPLYHALKAQRWCALRLIHTGQHYSPEMSQQFWDELGLPAPDESLNVGSGTHAEHTGKVLIEYERVAARDRPRITIVVGDVDSSLACALAATKLGIAVGHVEAGLRCFDPSLPEEINRVLIDHISDYLWTPSEDADFNLAREGISGQARVRRVGNIMVDSFELQREKIEALPPREELRDLLGRAYLVLTLHRPSNVDSRARLTKIVEILNRMSRDVPILFPVHPRTEKSLRAFGLWRALQGGTDRMRLLAPVGYVEFMSWVRKSAVVVTDSGGVQEETTYLGIPCLTLRENTERPITTTQGTNQLVRLEDLEPRVAQTLARAPEAGKAIALWDGKTAQRIGAHLKDILS